MSEEGRKKIVVVDDVNYSLLAVKEGLKKHYSVFTAQSAEILFGLLENTIPDLILLDVNIPEVNGYQILEKIKEDERLTEIPVVFLSAQKDRNSVMKGLGLGAADFLFKPITKERLIESIEFQLDPSTRSKVKPLILAVDDNPSILKSLNYLLRDLYEVRTISDPSVVKDLLKLTTPDLFILDCKMPDIHGFDIVPIIRKSQLHDDTPIIFLTTEGTVDNITVAMNLGASDFIIKPIEKDVLREKIAFHLKDFMIRRRLRAL